MLSSLNSCKTMSLLSLLNMSYFATHLHFISHIYIIIIDCFRGCIQWVVEWQCITVRLLWVWFFWLDQTKISKIIIRYYPTFTSYHTLDSQLILHLSYIQFILSWEYLLLVGCSVSWSLGDPLRPLSSGFCILFHFRRFSRPEGLLTTESQSSLEAIMRYLEARFLDIHRSFLCLRPRHSDHENEFRLHLLVWMLREQEKLWMKG